jgi:cell wall-associated NlpC family hydrolase
MCNFARTILIMRSLFFIFIFISVMFIQAGAENVVPDTTDTCLAQHMEMIDSIITYGKKYIGTPYRYGGKGPKAFDCSGFVSFLFQPYGLSMPVSSKAYVNVGEEIDVSEARKGDFALFRGRNASSQGVGHVALVIDVNEDGSVLILHATVHKGVTIDNMTTQDYYIKRYLSMRRITPACESAKEISSEE